MSDPQRQQLYELLLGDISPLDRNSSARHHLEKLALDDLEKIEPLVDKWLLDAWIQGASEAQESRVWE